MKNILWLLLFVLTGACMNNSETEKYQNKRDNIVDFCFDKGNNRIIMSLNDEIQFAHLDLKKLLDD